MPECGRRVQFIDDEGWPGGRGPFQEIPPTTIWRGRHIVLTRPLDPPGPRLPTRPTEQRTGVWLALEEAFRRLLEPIVLTESITPPLYRRLEREATVILEDHRRRGAITGYRVRCDESTRGDAPGPVIEVQFSEPKRVESVILRFGDAHAHRRP